VRMVGWVERHRVQAVNFVLRILYTALDDTLL